MTDALIRMPAEGGVLRAGVFALDRVSLTLTREASFAEWARLGAFLKTVEQANHWWIGDWLLYGEGHYADRVADIVAANGWDEQTLKVDRWVAVSVSPVRRLTCLSFGHHSQVAALLPEEQT